jgi:hypothetical protein
VADAGDGGKLGAGVDWFLFRRFLQNRIGRLAYLICLRPLRNRLFQHKRKFGGKLASALDGSL